MKTVTFRLRAIFCGLVLGATTPGLFAAAIEFSCDVGQGFSAVSGSQSTVGYITALTIGTTPLRADFTCKNPMDGSAIAAVAVLSQINWSGDVSSPISFTAQVSTANKQTVTTFLHQTMSNSQPQIGFVVFSYDPVAHKYYKSFFPVGGATLNGSIAKSGTTPQLNVGSSPGSVQSPANYTLSLAATPPSASQKIQYATSSASAGAVKSWGLAVQ